jgi:tRNA dimethylallyltransferase
VTGADLSTRRIVVVAGPTGSGKSALAMHLAAKLGGEILSCDSVQVYRGFDIGSAKPTPAERAAIPHHLVDIADWHDEVDAAVFAKLATAATHDVLARGRVPIICGGTGLYLRALLQQDWHDDLPKDEALREALRLEDSAVLYERLRQIDPERAAALHCNDRFRVVRALELAMLLGGPVSRLKKRSTKDPGFAAHVIVLNPERSRLHRAIEQRAGTMLAAGLIDEVRDLLAGGVAQTSKPMQSIGYKQVVEHLERAAPLATLQALIVAATRQYAKRQCTWFRKVEADQRLTEWDADVVASECAKALKQGAVR